MITIASFSAVDERKRKEMEEMEKMEMDAFASKVCSALREKLGHGYTVEVRKVKKNNGIILHGMTIATKSQNVVPTIYLEFVWDDYKKGVDFKEIIKRILEIYQRDMPAKNIDMEFFRSFTNVKDRICYRLINRKENENLLAEIPHTEFLDLAVCFYYAYHDDILGDGTILIHNSHLEMWDTSTAELLSLAKDNTPRLFPWVCWPIWEVINEVEGFMEEKEMRETQEDLFGVLRMKILSNQNKTNGAVCILYPGVLEEIAEKEGNFYIMPSSIHEVILLPDDSEMSAGALKEMIHDVNAAHVAPEDILSDSLYYYDAKRKEVVMV